jgi:hypothetical protein
MKIHTGNNNIWIQSIAYEIIKKQLSKNNFMFWRK